MDFDVRIPVPAVWASAEQVQETIWGAVFLAGRDESVADSVSMVSCELVENAVKYGAQDKPGERIGFSAHAKRDTVVVKVSCKSRPDTGPDVERLEQIVQWIDSYDDPWRPYEESLARATEPSGSMGLVRIAYEAGARLGVIREAELLTVSATIPVGVEVGG